MNKHTWMVLALALGLMTPGCILTSGQIQIDFDLPSFAANSATGIDGTTVDLSTEKEWNDNKDKLKDLSDLAVLGKFTNNAGSAVNVEVWMTPDPTSYTSTAALQGDATALKVWGAFQVAPNATTVIDWNKSAALFTPAGKAALLKEAKGDGQFTLYAVSPGAATYDFTVQNGALVLVIDVGI